MVGKSAVEGKRRNIYTVLPPRFGFKVNSQEYMNSNISIRFRQVLQSLILKFVAELTGGGKAIAESGQVGLHGGRRADDREGALLAKKAEHPASTDVKQAQAMRFLLVGGPVVGRGKTSGDDGHVFIRVVAELLEQGGQREGPSRRRLSGDDVGDGADWCRLTDWWR